MTDPASSPSHFDDLIGLTIVESSPDGVTATVEIRPELQQPYGIVHGGVLCSLVESVGSISGAIWSGGGVVGTSNHTNFIKATRSGTLTATSTPIQRGRTQQLWNIDITDDTGRLIATGQLRLANIKDTSTIGTS